MFEAKAIALESRLIRSHRHNPLGKVFSETELLAIGNMCVKYGVIILSDEVYERLHYTTSFPRIAALSPEIARHTVTIGSIGKAFNATGWRVGYAIGDKDLIRHVQNAHIILSYTTAGPAQMAAAVGLEQAEQHSFWETNRNDMKRKIDGLCETFRQIGLPVSFEIPIVQHNRLVLQLVTWQADAISVCRAVGGTLCSCQCWSCPISPELPIPSEHRRQVKRLEAVLVPHP